MCGVSMKIVVSPCRWGKVFYASVDPTKVMEAVVNSLSAAGQICPWVKVDVWSSGMYQSIPQMMPTTSFWCRSSMDIIHRKMNLGFSRFSYRRWIGRRISQTDSAKTTIMTIMKILQRTSPQVTRMSDPYKNLTSTTFRRKQI